MRATGLRTFAVSEDGREVKLTFAIENGDDIEITLDEFGAGRAAVDLVTAVSLAAQSSSRATAGVVGAATPTQIRAGLDEGEPDTVLLSFRMPNGLEHNFAFPAIDARNLSIRIRDIVLKEIPARKTSTAH